MKGVTQKKQRYVNDVFVTFIYLCGSFVNVAHAKVGEKPPASQIKSTWHKFKQSKPIQSIKKGFQKVFTFDRYLFQKGRKLKDRYRRYQAKKFDNRIRKLKQIPQEIILSRKKGRTKTLYGDDFKSLETAITPLLSDLHLVNVNVTDPKTGQRRRITKSDVELTQQILKTTTQALQNYKLAVNSKSFSIHRILKHPQIAALVRAHYPHSGDQAQFFKDYRLAISTLQSINDAYVQKISWPNIHEDKSLRSICRTAQMENDLLLVAIRKKAPDTLIKNIQTLTHKHYDTVTHLWLDPLMKGQKASEDHLMKNGATENVKSLFRSIIKFRDQDAVKVSVVHGNQRNANKEKQIKHALKGISRDIGLRVAKTGYYTESSKETQESFLRMVAIGSGIGFSMDKLSTVINNPTILKWKPTVLGGWDDVVGGIINYKELREIGREQRGVMWDTINSIGFAAGTSIALGVNLPGLGGKSLASYMLNTSTPLLPRMFASGIYGVASSGSTIAMSFLPARHYVKSILNLVKTHAIEHPKDKHGNPLQGRRLQRWARWQSLKAHLSYSAQKGGLIGVGLAGLLSAGFGILPGWGGFALANVLLGIGGAAETFTTGFYLHGRRMLDEYQIERQVRKNLSQIRMAE